LVQIANQVTARLLALNITMLYVPCGNFPQTMVRLREKYLNVLLARRYVAPWPGVRTEGRQGPRGCGGRGCQRQRAFKTAASVWQPYFRE